MIGLLQKLLVSFLQWVRAWVWDLIYQVTLGKCMRSGTVVLGHLGCLLLSVYTGCVLAFMAAVSNHICYDLGHHTERACLGALLAPYTKFIWALYTCLSPHSIPYMELTVSHHEAEIKIR